VPPLAKSNASGELLNVIDVDAVHVCAVVGKQGCQWPSYDFTAVDDSDGAAMQPVTIGQNGVVDAQVLKDLDNSQGGARQNALLSGGRVKEANVLVHIEEIAMRQSLDVLVDGNDLLQVLVLAAAEDGVVDNDGVYGRVVVGFDEAVLEPVAVDLAQFKGEATGASSVWHLDSSNVRCDALFNTCLARPLGVHSGCGVGAREEADQQRLALELLQPAAHFFQQAFGNAVGQHDFAVGRLVSHSDCCPDSTPVVVASRVVRRHLGGGRAFFSLPH